MRIAFVGKGGAGKSTVSALFSQYLVETQKIPTLLLDVDVNCHIDQLFDIQFPEERKMNYGENSYNIRKYFKGTNPHISLDEFIKTTPPGSGSNFLEISTENYVIHNFAVEVRPNLFMMATGSYLPNAVGQSCHHGPQAVAENILWFSKIKETEAVIIDSSAGVDHFGNTLFFQDLLVFVAKPDRESLNVFRQFYDLAKQSGREKHISLLINQIRSGQQLNFVKSEFPLEPIAIISESDRIMAKRLANKPLGLLDLEVADTSAFEAIFHLGQQRKESLQVRYEALLMLHTKLSSKDSWKRTYRPGLEDQIDPNYIPE